VLQTSLDIYLVFIYTMSMMTLNFKPLKPRNLVAKDLRSPKYRMRVESDKKTHKRVNKRDLMGMLYNDS